MYFLFGGGKNAGFVMYSVSSWVLYTIKSHPKYKEKTEKVCSIKVESAVGFGDSKQMVKNLIYKLRNSWQK
jgi:hypothetical protein